jgi:hypothetical protein
MSTLSPPIHNKNPGPVPHANTSQPICRRRGSLRALRGKTIVGLIVLVSLLSYISFGIHYSLYRPVHSANYLWAVYHVHSTYSDGLKAPEEIARQARLAGVSLVLLTDHGNPNFESSALHREFDGVTVIGGSEARLPDGRLTFFGARDVPDIALATFPPEAMKQAREWGAFPVVAYSEDPLYGWRYWETDLVPGGIELSNMFTCVRSVSVYDKLALILFYPFSHYYFIKSVSFPAKSFAHWDDLLQRGKIWSLVASDAHGGFHVGKFLTVNIPSYSDVFSFAGLGIDKKYAAHPEQAIRNGNFFNCIRGAGEPQLFDFSASDGGAIYTSGSNPPEKSELHVNVEVAGLATRLILRRNGKIERQIDSGHLTVQGASAGVYRLEVYLLNHPLLPADVPWIVSNPIFVGGVATLPHRELYSETTGVRAPRTNRIY